MTGYEERLCELARVNIAWQGYLVGGSEIGFWPFRRWQVWASKDGQEYEVKAKSLPVALYTLMLLPEFGENRNA